MTRASKVTFLVYGDSRISINNHYHESRHIAVTVYLGYDKRLSFTPIGRPLTQRRRRLLGSVHDAGRSVDRIDWRHCTL